MTVSTTNLVQHMSVQILILQASDLPYICGAAFVRHQQCLDTHQQRLDRFTEQWYLCNNCGNLYGLNEREREQGCYFPALNAGKNICEIHSPSSDSKGDAKIEWYSGGCARLRGLYRRIAESICPAWVVRVGGTI